VVASTLKWIMDRYLSYGSDVISATLLPLRAAVHASQLHMMSSQMKKHQDEQEGRVWLGCHIDIKCGHLNLEAKLLYTLYSLATTLHELGRLAGLM
jgi:hypothetical protein